jgi:hypothetical protein
LYLPGLGRFNVDGYFGWQILDLLIDINKLTNIPDFTHSQIQILIGAVGYSKGYDIWIPQSDRIKLDWKLTKKFSFKTEIPERYEKIKSVICEVDILWLLRGSTDVKAMFEVEHSTVITAAGIATSDLFSFDIKSGFK